MMYTLVVYFALAYGGVSGDPAMLEASFNTWDGCMDRKAEMESTVSSHGSYGMVAFCMPPSTEVKEVPHVLDRIPPAP